MRLFKLFLLTFLAFAITSCDNGATDPETVDDFNRKAMLENWADNIIIPSFTDFATKATSLKTTGNQFADEPNLANLTELRAEWETAYKAWQNVSMFAIGKAEEIGLRTKLNTYPLDVEDVKNNIEQGSYDLALPSNLDAQGFPALDYLLFGLAGTEDEVLAFYTNSSNADSYKSYVRDVVDLIDALTQEVLLDWNGDYRDEFVNNSGNSATASVDRLVNDFMFYYEKHLRAGKVGIPAGVFSSSTLSTHVESPYKGDISKELLLDALDASQDFFNGKYFEASTTGESLKSYLNYLSTEKEETNLSDLINQQFEKARTEIQGLNDNFVEQIQQDNFQFLRAYDQLQLNVVLMKVDMLQALNINVDYVDADGDWYPAWLMFKEKIRIYFKEDVEAAPLAVFRILFGILMVLSMVRFWTNGWIEKLYLEPSFHFTYLGFEWVKPLGSFTYVIFLICVL